MKKHTLLTNGGPFNFYGEKILSKNFNSSWKQRRKLDIYKSINNRYIIHDVCHSQIRIPFYSSRDWEDRETGMSGTWSEIAGYKTTIKGGHNILEVFGNPKELINWLHPQIRMEIAESLAEISEDFRDFKHWFV